MGSALPVKPSISCFCACTRFLLPRFSCLASVCLASAESPPALGPPSPPPQLSIRLSVKKMRELFESLDLDRQGRYLLLTPSLFSPLTLPFSSHIPFSSPLSVSYDELCKALFPKQDWERMREVSGGHTAQWSHNAQWMAHGPVTSRLVAPRPAPLLHTLAVAAPRLLRCFCASYDPRKLCLCVSC